MDSFDKWARGLALGFLAEILIAVGLVVIYLARILFLMS